jgi:hypothetical protein
MTAELNNTDMQWHKSSPAHFPLRDPLAALSFVKEDRMKKHLSVLKVPL